MQYTRHTIGAILALVCLTGCAGGCADNAPLPSPEEVKAIRSEFYAEVDAAEKDLADLKVKLAELPADHTGRVAVEKAIAAIEKRLADLSKAKPAIDKLVESYEQGRPADGLAGALGAFGPWGSLAGIGLTIGWGVYERIKRARAATALRQTVVGLEANPLTPDQKAALRSAQDESTKAVIEQLRAKGAR